jgi:predicted TIM-barrel fold metal-dependent hydrolase
MADRFAFVDPHIHLWELSTGWYPLQEKGPESGEETHGVGDFSKIQGRDYTLDDYLEHAGDYDVRKLVHVTAAQSPPSWPDETRYLQDLYEKRGFPHGIIGWTDFERPAGEVDAELGAHAEYPNFRGVRHQSVVDYGSEHIDACFAIMQRRGLIYDAVAHEDSLPAAAATAERFGDMTFVLEHAGWPTAGTTEVFDQWRAGIKQFAAAPNTVAKISGLAMPLGSFEPEKVRPWVEAIIDAFGTDRCMFASNFPVDWLFTEYDTLLAAYREMTSGFSDAERRGMFVENAERCYRI